MTTQQNMRPIGPASTAGSIASLPNRWGRRLRHHIRGLFMRGDFSSLLMTIALMATTALPLDAAGWTEGLAALPIISVVSVVLGFLLTRSHYSELLALILSSVYGLAAIIGVNAYILIDEGSLHERTLELASRVETWISGALEGSQPANDGVVFVLFLSVLFWFLGHNVAWHVFRVDRVWRVILPTGLVLITNQFYYQGDASLDIYLVAFVLLALLLLVRSHIEAREFDWYLHRISFPTHVRRTFFVAGSVLALAIVLAAWNAPTGQDEKNLDRLDDILSGDAFVDLAEMWNRLFSSLEGEGIATADYYGGEQLQLSGAIQLGDQPVMYVEAPFGPRYYWRSTVFDTFDSQGWLWDHFRTVRAYTDRDGLQLNIGSYPPDARQEVEQRITMILRATRLVHAAPQPNWLGLPVEVELNCVDDFGRDCVNENAPSDISIVRARETLRTGDTYTVRSSISTATADMLRATGRDYPGWVQGMYLQGANAVSPAVRELTTQIVQQAGAQTPYDQARAIESWLRVNIQYNESIPSYPPGSDPLEWFLLDRREGYCTYYATAMVMMLRTQGIPARMAAGFAQGTWDPERNAFLVRERDAHTWVEVYFPGYGWIEFEPTADEAPIDRPGDQLPQTVLPTATPLPTVPPTATPTIPPATATADASTGATPTSQSAAPVAPATATPSPTPQPSPTAPPPPEVTQVNSGDGSSVLRTILITLGVIVLVVLGIVLAILFTFWYIEYRGLRGLNGVQKAYARLGIYGRWLGLRFPDSSTPDERRRYLISEVPEGERPVNTITRLYIRDRYAAAPRLPEQHESQSSVAEIWKDARRAFLRHKFGRFRRQR